MRIVICGGARCGKSTLAQRLAREYGLQVVCTDSYMKFSWPVVPDLVIADLARMDKWILEGVQAARVLRRWLKEPSTPKIDSVYWLERPLVELTDGQQSLAKGVASVFADVRPVLQKAGTPILPGLPGFRPYQVPA